MNTQTQTIKPGDTIWTWCSRCGVRTDHRYTGTKLICLECEKKAEEGNKEQSENATQIT